MKKILMLAGTISFVCVVILSSPIIAQAIPVQWIAADGGNEHWYDFVETDPTITWMEANTASQSTFNSLQGHLITINSKEEQDFFWGIAIDPDIFSINPYSPSAWLGGYQTDTSSEPNGNWAWVTGEEWNYTNWYSGEPNNLDGDENYLTIHGTYGKGQWNDQDQSSTEIIGYIVEYESSSSPIPEPATMLLLGSGLIGFAGFRKKFRK